MSKLLSPIHQIWNLLSLAPQRLEYNYSLTSFKPEYWTQTDFAWCSIKRAYFNPQLLQFPPLLKT